MWEQYLMLADISSSIAFSLQHIIEKTNGNLTIF